MNYLNIYKQKLVERAKIVKGVDLSAEAKAAAKELCRRDYKFFINNFCWTYDPRADHKPNNFPFILYDFQEDYLDWLEARLKNNEDGLTDKSRDMGATWCYLAWDLWHWLFDENFHCLLGSRKEDLVDKYDNPDALFWKLDYMTKHLPSWLMPQGFSQENNRRSLLLSNPERKNTIVGESSNKDFSRQGRYTVIQFDEFAFWENDFSAWTAAGDATRCRMPISTPRGKANKFAQLRFESSIAHTTLRWDQHPLKDEAWYEKQTLRMTARELAQEVDVDYQASGGDLWLPIYHQLKEQIEVKEPINVSDEWYLYGSIDHHSRKPTSCHIYAIDYDGHIYSIDEMYLPEATTDDIDEWFEASQLYPAIREISADPQLWAKDQQVRKGLKAFTVSRAQMIMDGATKDGALKTLVPGIKGKDLDARSLVSQLIENEKLSISPLCPKQRWELGEALHWSEDSNAPGNAHEGKEVLADKDNHAWDDLKYFLTRNPSKPIRPAPKVKVNTVEYFRQLRPYRSRQKVGV